MPETVLKIFQIASSFSIVELILSSSDRHIRERNPDPFDLRCLIAQENSMDVLLPQLEDFELHETRDSDETLLQFITSRMGVLPHVSSLKRFKITMDRLKDPYGVDISEKARVRARELGISMDLLLEYPTPVAHVAGHINSLSPSYIFGYRCRRHPDWTWELREFDEEDNFQWSRSDLVVYLFHFQAHIIFL